MDEVQRLRSMNKEKMRKKRAEQYRRREEQREEERKQRRQLSAAHRTSDNYCPDESKRTLFTETAQDKKKSSSKDDGDKGQHVHFDHDKKPASGWLSASNDSARKPKRSPPKYFMGSPGGASVSSSLTRTPSPAQHAKKPALRPWDCVDLDEDELVVDKKPRFNKRVGLPPLPARKPRRQENDSSDDDDLVREAKKLVEQQRETKPSARERNSPSRRKKAPRPPQNLDDDSDEDEFIREARLLAQKKLPKRESNNTSSEASQESQSSGNEEKKASARRQPRQKQKSVRSSLDPPVDSSLEESLDCCQKPSLKSNREKVIESSDDSPSSPSKAVDSRPLNPLPVRLNTSIDVEKSDSGDGEGNHTAVARRPPPANLDALWSDSDTEQVEVEKVPGKKRKRKQNKVSSDASPKKVAHSPGRNVGVKRKAKARKLQNSVSDDEKDYGDDETEGDQLKPDFAIPKLGPPSALEPLVLKYSKGQRVVPAAINRYLKGYQREGVVFMHGRVAENQGVILGDDMGLGKTVQVISMLAALLKKAGTGEDKIQLNRKQRIIKTKLDNDRKERERALRNGTIAEVNTVIEGIKMSKWAPILIVVPPSVVDNWMNEFQTWGHFGVANFSGTSRDRALDRIRTGLDEIMVCGRSMFLQPGDLIDIKKINWRLIIVDEFHQYKNFKTIAYEGLKSLKETCGAPLVGLTGTMMQNNHEELWSQVDLVHPGFLGSIEEFKGDISVPIKIGRTKTADDAAIEESNEVREYLQSKLKSFYIQRRKIDVLKDELPEKDERVLFCELSPLQKRLYQHFMTLPDFVLLKYANSPCECGVNQAIFQGFRRMRTEAEKVAYQRANKNDIVPRKKCCHQRPLNLFRFDAGQEMYDPRAPLWRWQHQHLIDGQGNEDENECVRCPFCIAFAALDKLYKLSSHVSLLQVRKHPREFVEGSKGWKDAQKSLDFAEVAFPEDVLESLQGGYFREDGIMNDHINLSGKMKVLAELLVEFDRRDDRLLIFSFSTQMLDLIQNFVKAQGYSFLRLDGSTPTKLRQGLVDKYQKDESIFLFLISTKAGGLGLNLTAANVVIVFDVDFNPSNDEQSQDRAYRIGQKKDVLVIRLVSRGTVEELKYIRQIYKVQLTKDTMGNLQGNQAEDSEATRLFRGVDGDKDRKGELFGMENLLKYKDGSFMQDLWKSSNTNKALKGLEKFGLRSNNDMAEGLEGMSPEAVIELGGNIADAQFLKEASKVSDDEDEEQAARTISVSDILRGDNARNHEDFLRADRGDALYQEGDEGFYEEMGGESQAAHYVMENADVPLDRDEHTEPIVDKTTIQGNLAPSPVLSRPRSIPSDTQSASANSGPSPVLSRTRPLPSIAQPTGVAPEPSPVFSRTRPLPSDIQQVRAAPAPSPVKSAPTVPLSQPRQSLHRATRQEEPPMPRSPMNSPIATDAQSSSSASPPSRLEPQRMQPNAASISHPRKPRKEKATHPVAAAGKTGETTFTTKDLFLPSYTKKKKKKKKKSM